MDCEVARLAAVRWRTGDVYCRPGGRRGFEELCGPEVPAVCDGLSCRGVSRTSWEPPAEAAIVSVDGPRARSAKGGAFVVTMEDQKKLYTMLRPVFSRAYSPTKSHLYLASLSTLLGKRPGKNRTAHRYEQLRRSDGKGAR